METNFDNCTHHSNWNIIINDLALTFILGNFVAIHRLSMPLMYTYHVKHHSSNYTLPRSLDIIKFFRQSTTQNHGITESQKQRMSFTSGVSDVRHTTPTQIDIFSAQNIVKMNMRLKIELIFNHSWFIYVFSFDLSTPNWHRATSSVYLSFPHIDDPNASYSVEKGEKNSILHALIFISVKL